MGKFIVFEGIDGSGKSTQIDLLGEYLNSKGIDFVQTREPGGTELAENLRKIMLEEKIDGMTEMLVVLAARNDHIQKFIKPNLSSGKWVICDRFTDSTIAYQGFARGISMNLIEKLSSLIENQIIINKIIFLDIDPEVAIERIRSRNKTFDKFDSENINFFQLVREGFKYASLSRKENSLWVDGSKPSNKIFELIKNSLFNN
mgnify:CR=1 FL=1